MGYNSSFEKGGIFYKEGSDKYGLGNTEIFIQEENDMYCVYDNVWNEENENWEIKKIADFDTMDEAKEFAIEHSKKEYSDGGSLPFMTDPNFGNFQNTGSFADGGYFDKLEDVRFLFNVGEKIKIPQMENGKIQVLIPSPTIGFYFIMMFMFIHNEQGFYTFLGIVLPLVDIIGQRI
jgi:hypothetical protein